MKKSVSGGTLRSPNVKRSVESPVTIRGWLYKQGSDGLMLWKKRWFVLSEYCLFYYKGPEEDKILGSILLPSYTITPCDSNDHIYRKFAFKAEHQNMRTYFFAAENKKEMQQWMNTMSLASILQNQNHHVDESLDRVSKEMSSNHNRRGGGGGGEEEDPGFSIYQPRRQTEMSPSNDGALISSRHHNANDYPNSYMMNEAENSFHSDDVPYLQPAHHTYMMNTVGRYPVDSRMDHQDHHNSMEFGGGGPNNIGGQPMGMNDSGGVPRSQHHLYANAPPKPKRMGSSRDLIYESHVEAIPLPSYHSAAATAVIAKPRSPFVESAGFQQQYAVSPGRPPREYMTELNSPARRALPEEFQQSNVVMVSHRRTPDPYARTVPPHMFSNEMGDKQYREDEYAATIAAVAGKMHARSPHGDLQSPSHAHSRKYPQQKIQNVRPQSAADFLETDIYSDGGGSSSSRVNNNVSYKQLPQTHQHSARNVLSRPMSSIEPQLGLNDDICGDVERFKGSLKKGRNSPSVLYGGEKDISRKTPEVMYRENENLVRTPQQTQSLIATNPLCNKSFDSHSNNNNSNNIAALSSENYRKAAQRASTPTMTLTSSSSLAALDRTTPMQQMNSQTSTPTPAWNQMDPNYTLPRDRSFLRSYSARFPVATATSTSAQTDGYRDGSSQYDSVKTNGGAPALKIQQREESMKRLLEWKQRMLQSPLTRKYIPKSDSSSTFQKQVHLMASSAATTPSSTMISALETLQNRQQAQPVKHRLSQPPMSTSFHTPDGNEMKRYLPGEDHRIPRTQSAMQVGLRNSSEVEPRLMPEMMKDRFGKPIHSAPSKSPARMSNRIQDHRRSTSSLNRFYSSYSSDDEESWSASSMQNESENWLAQSGLSSQQQRFLAKRKYRSESPNVVDASSASQMNVTKQQPELHNLQEVNVSESLMDAQKKLQKMKFNLSAGDLLGKSHEELVLLLIQLRRDQTKLEHKLNKCRVELEARQRLIQMNSLNSSDQNVSHKQMLQQYDEMAKQYELTKPLVNLVDNMVKLGSLYGTSEQLFDPKSRPESSADYSNPKKMLEFSRMLQEQRLQNDNQFTDWYHLQQLEQKLQEASKLDTVLLEESHVVSDLQQDKDMLEKVVENLRSKLNSCRDSPVELEKLQKQLRTAEKELLKIRNQLSQGAQKLEETAADNARIENEIGMLRQRVQSSIIQGLGNDNSSKASYIKVQLEKELSRISNVMEDLAWKRKELSGALEQLKDRNKALLADVRASPTGVAGSMALPSRKNHRSTYLETDLDTMETKDIIESWKQGEGTYSSDQKSDQLGGVPLYVNTYASSTGSDDASTVTASSVKEDIDSSIDSEQFRSDAYEPQDIVEADDRTKRYYGLIPRDKPAEIKTVRIVKRESERRSKVRDRRKSDLDGDGSLVKIGEEAYEPGYSEQPELSEETIQMCHTMSLPRNFGQSLTDSNGFSSSTILGLKLTPTNAPGNDSVSTPSSTTSGKNVSYYYRTPSLSSLNSEPSSSSSSFSARDRLFGRSTVTTTTTVTSFSSSHHHPNCGFSSSPTSMSPMTIPTFKSETARKIVAETAASDILSNQTGRGMHDSLLVADEQSEPDPVVRSHDRVKCKTDGVKRRQKRRAYTISSSQPLTLETTMQRMVHARSRDDLDIEQCLRSANTPDVVKSTIRKNVYDVIDESTIDRELGLPQKIVIPERYVEETSEEPSPAEQLHRLQKAESIRKMLSESTTYGDSSTQEEVQSSTLKKKFEADRKQREHLLALNQIIAKEVMERSKAVAASFTGPLDNK